MNHFWICKCVFSDNYKCLKNLKEPTQGPHNLCDGSYVTIKRKFMGTTKKVFKIVIYCDEY